MKTPLNICLVDMNNGVANQATRCFRRVVDAFKTRVRGANPALEIRFKHVQPRNLGELPERNVDLVLSSGGPGSPYDGFEDAWCEGYRSFLDWVVERNQQDAANAPAAMLVCHSFEIAVSHFKVAQMVARPSGRKFGVMPIYTTDAGRTSVLFKPFGDRLFAWEHRFWEAGDLDEKRLAELGGKVLARESRPGLSDKGSAYLSFEFAPGIMGTQFHPEADRAGILAWVYRPEHAEEFKKAYGEVLYDRMIKTLDNPDRVARTFALLIPSWLTHQFNRLATARGLSPIGPPVQDLSEFQLDPPKAAAG